MSGADRIKGLRAKEFAQSDAGGPPLIFRPKRKRAFHRALKRRESWALMKQATRDCMNMIAKAMYEDILKPSPFLGLLPKVSKE